MANDKQDINIDDYDEFDFGFSTVDEQEVEDFESKVRSKVAEESASISNDLELKINKLLEARSGDTSKIQELVKKRKDD